jgi:tetratricopeptide (TPR) repeat protein
VEGLARNHEDEKTHRLGYNLETMWTRCLLALPLLPALLCAETSGRLEVTSPLGAKFYSLPDEKGVVAAAEKALAAHPKDVKLMLKLSQAQASVRQNREAVDTCTRALKLDPGNAELLTERGHRQLPMRQFARARDDLKRAAAIDPKLSDAYYHLGLANYFLGDFGPAADAFCKGVGVAKDQDSMVNFTNWCYAASRRAGRKDEAAKALAKVGPEMKSNEGHTQYYFNLVRFFQGHKTEAEIAPKAPSKPTDTEAELTYDTVGYGIANWHLYNGEPAKAKESFERIVKGNVWVTWGFIGSETELVRMAKK